MTMRRQSSSFFEFGYIAIDSRKQYMSYCGYFFLVHELLLSKVALRLLADLQVSIEVTYAQFVRKIRVIEVGSNIV
ncbi:15574_t:CDS:2 [Acaulospora morrowiae]|uniref:15574_t:CDS:1 n=1 Tax=Acaulospora morrowiae TaxID=94023 RepID=A0A9N9A3R1_9GLOM|nr:15574_t:CDS:2 [Acaulospora morrowiae]